jgi:hypothetical protein
MPMKPLTTAEQLERWFENSDNPVPSSKVAELMRELVEKSPNLSFEQMHQLARTGDVEDSRLDQARRKAGKRLGVDVDVL